jgi:hypothetical protein
LLVEIFHSASQQTRGCAGVKMLVAASVEAYMAGGPAAAADQIHSPRESACLYQANLEASATAKTYSWSGYAGIPASLARH